MTLYKFKSLDEFEFIADIIMNNRLYSTEFTNLNDPMEGVFEYDNTVDRSIIERIVGEKRKHKICALTKNYHNPILWAHYANSFKGICIEVEIDEKILTPHEITYGSFTPIISAEYDNIINFRQEPDQWAISALTRKYEDWAYEEEVRLLNNKQNVYIEKGVSVKSILFGVHTSSIYKQVIEKITPTNVNLFYTTLDNLSQVNKHLYIK